MRNLRHILLPILAAILSIGVQACAGTQNSYFGYNNDPDRGEQYAEAEVDVSDAAPPPASAPNAPAANGGNYYAPADVNPSAGQAAALRDWDAEAQPTYAGAPNSNINYAADPIYNEGANVYIENYYDYSDPNYFGGNSWRASYGPRYHAWNYRPGWSVSLALGHPHYWWGASYYSGSYYWDDYYCYRPVLRPFSLACRPWYNDWYYTPGCSPWYGPNYFAFYDCYPRYYRGWNHWYGHDHYYGHYHGHGHYYENDRPKSDRSYRDFGANSGVGATAGGVTRQSGGSGGRGRGIVGTTRGSNTPVDTDAGDVNTRSRSVGMSEFGSATSARTRSGNVTSSAAGTAGSSGQFGEMDGPVQAAPSSPRTRTLSSGAGTASDTRTSDSPFGASGSNVQPDANPRAADSWARTQTRTSNPSAAGAQNTSAGASQSQPLFGETGPQRGSSENTGAARDARTQRWSNPTSTSAAGSNTRSNTREQNGSESQWWNFPSQPDNSSNGAASSSNAGNTRSYSPPAQQEATGSSRNRNTASPSNVGSTSRSSGSSKSNVNSSRSSTRSSGSSARPSRSSGSSSKSSKSSSGGRKRKGNR